MYKSMYYIFPKLSFSACSNLSATSQYNWFQPVLPTAIWPHWSRNLYLITAPQFNPDWGERTDRILPETWHYSRVGKMIDWQLKKLVVSIFLELSSWVSYLTIFPSADWSVKLVRSGCHCHFLSKQLQRCLHFNTVRMSMIFFPENSLCVLVSICATDAEILTGATKVRLQRFVNVVNTSHQWK